MKSLRIRKILKSMGYNPHNKFGATYYYKDGLELSPTTVKKVYKMNVSNLGRKNAQSSLLNCN
ncbi:hypothetical protein [Lysinibacillus sp. Bpr_S20]|uniref:hypothetical protein n=1 Tax=Lysinibacillus sp. Bpr_S20 TaxID=2933964 RepID=UPI0020124B12|nr:hypothetical protein [Lysinibacillus sp. Bpr_S20]MCL1700766.1 hypothetical protein [Lysinibacillus sp. Bpr_S20]